MKKSRAFVPAASPLEERIALSSGISALDIEPPTKTANGTPVLTSRAYHQALYGVGVSYYHFTHDSYIYARLDNDLLRTTNRIPLASTDGLSTTLANDVSALQAAFDRGTTGTHATVLASEGQVIADIKAFVASEVAAGRFIFVRSNKV